MSSHIIVELSLQLPANQKPQNKFAILKLLIVILRYNNGLNKNRNIYRRTEPPCGNA